MRLAAERKGRKVAHPEAELQLSLAGDGVDGKDKRFSTGMALHAYRYITVEVAYIVKMVRKPGRG